MIRLNLRRLVLLINSGILMLSGSLVLMSLNVPTASAQVNFDPGHIIDNAIFTNSSSMNVAEIQSFLNSQSNCDTNGAQTISYYYNPSTGEVNNSSSGTWTSSTRLTYGQRYATWYNAHPYTGYVTNMSVGPYVCLENYVENPSTGQNNLQNPTASISGGESAAQIIYNAAQQYSINPQVILTTLQKEQGLVTDTWPWTYEYQEAMGFNCPDSSGCSGYAGFYQQVNAATAQYRNYLDNPQNFNYVIGNNTIDYGSPYGGCSSSSTVNIQSLATAALYDYTPYQPDANVLNATNPPGSSSGPGSNVSGDVCASYGNRNFWWYFNSWFGSSIQANLPGCTAATNTTLACIWNMSNPSNYDQYLTGSISTRDELYTAENYQYLGISFYGNVIEEPGNLPVYLNSKPGGGSFLTTNLDQYYTMMNNGWSGDGVGFYASPPGANTGWQVYELYDQATNQYYYTTSQSDINSRVASGWVNEGDVFTSIDPIRQETPPPPGLLNVYRFYIPQSYSHFWTSSLTERDNMIQAGYDYEGVAWYSSSNSNDVPVYRLYAPSILQHLWTTSVQEKNGLVAAGGWNYEGISQYVTMTPNSVPIYRLYAPTLGTHLYTESLNERNTLVASGGWNYEGIAWYQPTN